MSLLSIANFRLSLIFLLVFAGCMFLPRMAEAALIQNDYRFYVNTNAIAPTDPWPAGGTDLGENTAATGSNALQNSDIIRVRLSVNVTTSSESGHAFKLQYKAGTPCSSGTWTDVGGLGSGEIWRGYDNTSVTDGATLTSNLLAVSDVSQTYEEANNSATMPSAINVNEDGEWDWAIQNNGASEGTTYCFRMVKSDGTVLDGGYNDYPTLATLAFTPVSKNWRWYDDATNETPTEALAVENAQPFGQPVEDPIKLRLTVKDSGGLAATDQKFKLQFSTSSTFASGVNDLTEIGSCSNTSLWCYADGVDTNDSAIATLVLGDSVVKGTHNESGTATSTFDHAANAVVEYEWTIQSRAGVSNGTIYYFRAYDVNRSAAVALDTAETYPSIKTRETTLSFTLAGVASGTTVDGYTTNVATTATTIPFGTLAPNQPKIAAQRLTVSTDGESYKVYILADGQLRTAGGDQIDPATGTNASPSAWAFAVSSQSTKKGQFGYHPDDDALSDGSTRFQVNDTWARLDTTEKEIIYTGTPMNDDIHDVLFQVEITALQPNGSYANEIQYLVTPTF